MYQSRLIEKLHGWMLRSVALTLLLVAGSAAMVTAQSGQAVYQAPALENPQSWTMVVLPDLQSYSKFARNQGIMDLINAWALDQRENLNIAMVVGVGDLVEQNNIPKGDGVNGDQSSAEQWAAIDRAFRRLDGRLPYVLATGNHDYGIASAENRETFYDDWITFERNPLSQALLREHFTHPNGRATLANSIHELVDPQGIKYLILNLEFGARDETIEWAARSIGQEKYREHRVIVISHAYMSADNRRIAGTGYKITGANYGEQLWQKLIHPSSNVVMVLGGHIARPDDPAAHLAFKREARADGGMVAQMVFNAQALGGGWHGNGGDGWLRYLEFMPDGRTVKVKTFSPLFAISPSTRHLAWRRAPRDEFEFVIDTDLPKSPIPLEKMTNQEQLQAVE
jgi:hypothetical protein